MKKKYDDEDDLYFDNSGLVVFTEKYLLERGYCCGNGCRHCPYDYKNVEEPKRSVLRQAQDERKKNEESNNNKES